MSYASQRIISTGGTIRLGTADLEAPNRGGTKGETTPILASVNEEVADEKWTAAEIQHSTNQIQARIVRRRRKKALALIARLSVLVFLPTICISVFYFGVATPLFPAQTELIITTQNGSSASASSSPAAGTASSTVATQEAAALQGYLTSQTALDAVQEQTGFSDAFRLAQLHPLQVLLASDEEKRLRWIFDRSVTVSFDPADGVIKLEVLTPNPRLSVEVAEALTASAENQLESFSRRPRDDQMARATADVRLAEQHRDEAVRELVYLQSKLGLLDPDEEERQVLSRIGGLEETRIKKQRLLSELSASDGISSERLQKISDEIDRLGALIKSVKDGVQKPGDPGGVADRIAQVRVAEARLATREELLSSAVSAMEAARADAERQRKYLVRTVPASVSNWSTHPESSVFSIYAFAGFSGFYLLVSLSLSVLREQM